MTATPSDINAGEYPLSLDARLGGGDSGVFGAAPGRPSPSITRFPAPAFATPLHHELPGLPFFPREELACFRLFDSPFRFVPVDAELAAERNIGKQACGRRPIADLDIRIRLLARFHAIEEVRPMGAVLIIAGL